MVNGVLKTARGVTSAYCIHKCAHTDTLVSREGGDGTVQIGQYSSRGVRTARAINTIETQS